MAISFNIYLNSTWSDITQYVVKESFKVEETLYTDLSPNSNTASFSVFSNTSLVNSLIINKAPINVEIKDGLTYYFKGILAPTYKESIYGNGISVVQLTVEDYTNTKLKKLIRTSFRLTGFKVCDTSSTSTSILHYLATAAGVSLDASVLTINIVVPDLCVLAEDKKTYYEILKDVLFEATYSFYFTADGYLKLYQWGQATVVGNSNEFDYSTTTDILDKVENNKIIEKYDEVVVNYDKLIQKTGITLFEDTNGATGVLPCYIPVNILDYYPVGSGTKTVYSEYKNDAYDIVSATAASLSTVVDGAITLQTALTNYGRKGSFSYKNTSGSTKYITKMRIVGDAYVKSDSCTLRYTINPQLETSLEYNCKYLYDDNNTAILGVALQQYYTFADFTSTLGSTKNFAIGTLVKFNDTKVTNSTIWLRIIKRTYDYYGLTKGRYQYVCEGVGEYNYSGTPTSNVVITAAIPPSPSSTLTTLLSDYTRQDDIKGTLVSGVIKTNNYLASTAGFILNSDGTFEFNKDSTHRLYYDGSTLTLLGNIQATSGTVGSWNINTALYSGKTSLSSTVAGIYIGTDGISAGATGAPTFSITSAGALMATNATITGSITATSGSFTGAVYASSGSFTGSITSSSGTIGNFTLGTALYSGSKSSLTAASTGIYLGTDGIAIGSGGYNAASLFAETSTGNFSLGSALTYSGSTLTIATNFIVTGTASISGWILGSNLLSSAGTSNSIQLDQGNARISILDGTYNGSNYSTAARVVMGYLNTLPKNSGSGNWGSTDFGFWVKPGNTVFIDGALNVKNGDLISSDANIKILSSGNEILRLGTDTTNYGLHYYSSGTLIGQMRFDANGYVLSSKPIFSNNTLLNSFILNSSGANYGYVMNTAANTWALGYGTTYTTLGTAALTWNSSGNITIAGNLTVSGGTVTATTFAGTATNANVLPAQGWVTNALTTFQQTTANTYQYRGETSTGGPTGTWWMVENLRHSNGTNYWGPQIFWGWEDNACELYVYNYSGGTNTATARFLNTRNYNNYSPTLTGTGATGTWGITASYITSQANSATITCSASVVGSYIVQRDANGYIFGNYFNCSDDISTGTVSYLMGKFGDNYLRSATAAKVAAFISGQTMNISGWATSSGQSEAVKTHTAYTGPTYLTGVNIYTDGTYQALQTNSPVYMSNGTIYATGLSLTGSITVSGGYIYGPNTSPSLATVTVPAMLNGACYRIVAKIAGNTLLTQVFVYRNDISGVTYVRGTTADGTYSINITITSATSVNITSGYSVQGIVSIQQVG